MAEPFLSEIRIMSFGYAPRSWAMCNGQILPIAQNQALFALLGTTYGGNGQTTFALPDLRGRTPIHVGNSHTLGERGGEPSHQLSISEMPQHIHGVQASKTDGDAPIPTNFVFARTVNNIYGPPTNLTNTVSGTAQNAGGNQPHNNMQPFMTLNFSIALVGIFPSQT